MMELTTYTELEIAHRLMTAYAQKCRSLHGHRYEVEITVTAQKFNEDGMIVDFKKLKEVVKTVLDDKWDHGSCFNVKDPLVPAVEASGSERVHIINANPTLEWMVEHWALELQEALDTECPGVAVSMLKASETARNTVTWRCNCLPWKRSQPDDSKKPMCAEKDVSLLAACRGEKEKDARNAAYRRRLDAALRPAPKNHANWGFAKDTYTQEEDNPDAVPYLVSYGNLHSIGSTVVHSSLKGQALYDFCTGAVQSLDGKEDAVAVIGITRLPG